MFYWIKWGPHVIQDVYVFQDVYVYAAIGWSKYTSNSKKYDEVRTSLYGLNKANQYLNREVLMDDDCYWHGGKDDHSQWHTWIVSYIITFMHLADAFIQSDLQYIAASACANK